MKRVSFQQQGSQSKQVNETKLFNDCLKILHSESVQQNNKWLLQNKINSYSLRNDKAGEIVTTINYLFQKVLVGVNPMLQDQPQTIMLRQLFLHYKNSSKRLTQFCHLLKHFSIWDYQFEFFYQVFLGQQLQHITLYLTTRAHIIQSAINKYKKQVLSGVMAQIQQWSRLAHVVFKNIQERIVIQLFVDVVKGHYLEVKKNQNQRINGAQFFKISQIMAQRLQSQKLIQHGQMNKSSGSKSPFNKTKTDPTIGEMFKQSLLQGLTMEDRQLVRILSCKDKNIARLLEEKHNKVQMLVINIGIYLIKKIIQMVHIIGQEVDSLRKDIEIQKRKYLQVIQQKKSLVHLIQKLKKKTLQYVVDKGVKSQEQLLQMYEAYNKKYNPHSSDIQKCRREIQNKRLLQIIEEQQRLP